MKGEKLRATQRKSEKKRESEKGKDEKKKTQRRKRNERGNPDTKRSTSWVEIYSNRVEGLGSKGGDTTDTS